MITIISSTVNIIGRKGMYDHSIITRIFTLITIRYSFDELHNYEESGYDLKTYLVGLANHLVLT